MKWLILVFLTLFSLYSFADGNHGIEYRSADKDKSVFQLLYGSDATKIENICTIQNLSRFYSPKQSILKARQNNIWSMPKDHQESCKKYFEKEAKCPLDSKSYYLIYTLHEEPLSDSKITGALFLGNPFVDYDMNMKNENLKWKETMLSLDGKKQNRESLLHYPDDLPGYSWKVFLKDSKKIKNSHGHELTWIRFIDTPESKPAWLMLDQIYADDKGAVIDKLVKESVTPNGLEKGKSFVFNFRDINDEYLPVKITTYGKGGTSEKINEVPLNVDTPDGELCFEKIEDGKLYFRRQIIINIDKPYLKKTDPNVKKNYEYFRERHNDLPDIIYSIDLTEYLKHNFIRSIVPGSRKCDIDTFHMDKGIKFKAGEKLLVPLIPIEEDGFFYSDDYK